MARLVFLISVVSCQAGPQLPWPDVPWANASLASLLRSAPEEHVYDPSVLGNLAEKGEIADLRVPHGQAFVIYISVGTPPQTLRCLLDTGFADLWLPSERCEACGSGSRYFARERSRTFAEVTEPRSGGSSSSHMHPVRVPYSGGVVEGVVGQDTVALGWSVLGRQSFLLVPQASFPRSRDWDGICGLGMRQVAVQEEPLWKRLPSVSPGGRAILALVPGPGRRHDFVAGEVPYKACKEGTLAWAAVEPLRPGGERHAWVISGGLAIHKRSPVPSRFLLDTGVDFLLAPPRKYLPFVHSLFALEDFDHFCGWDPSAGNVVVCDCSIMQASLDLLPLRVYVGGRAFLLQIRELFRRVPTGDDGELCLLRVQRNPASSVDPTDLLGDLLDSEGNDTEAGRPRSLNVVPQHAARLAGRVEDPAGTRRLQALGEVPIDLEDDLWVIGGVFLEHFVVVLDFEGRRLGVAEPSDEALPRAHVEGHDVASRRTPPEEVPALNMTQPEKWAVNALKEKNVVLHEEVSALVHSKEHLEKEVSDLYSSKEEETLKIMKEEARMNNVVARLRNMEQQNRELENRVQMLQVSQEESNLKTQSLHRQLLMKQRKLAIRRKQRHRLEQGLEDLRQRHATLQRHHDRLMHERDVLREHGARMQLYATLACSTAVLLLVLGAATAWKVRHDLLLLRKGALEGTAREVRDVVPLIQPCSPRRSPRARAADDMAVE